ncbi:alginate lyase family protein [Rhodoferax koreense]|nr:alginate lyase family protein [Rhodoferax koreense]
MRSWHLLTAGLVLAVVQVLAAPAPQAQTFETATVRDSRASFIDVPARMRWLQAAAPDARLTASLPAAQDCARAAPVAPPAGRMAIPSHYARGDHGPLNPAYEASVALYRRFEATAATLANLYVATGQATYAQCLLDHLGRWAKAEALTGYTVSTAPGASNQAWYQAEWSTAAAALALSQVVHEPTLAPAQVDAVIAWLHRVSLQQIGHAGGDHTCCNNHAYWRGLHATMVGVLANDAALFRWGLGRYAVAMAQLGADGRWPLEMARGELAMHYQNFALLPLVLTAEIAAQQGVDLYAYRVHGRDLHSAVYFLARTYRSDAAQHALGLPHQDLRAFQPGRGDLAWAEFYRARFGTDPLALLASRPVFNARTGGSATLLAYRPPAVGR